VSAVWILGSPKVSYVSSSGKRSVLLKVSGCNIRFKNQVQIWKRHEICFQNYHHAPLIIKCKYVYFKLVLTLIAKVSEIIPIPVLRKWTHHQIVAWKLILYLKRIQLARFLSEDFTNLTQGFFFEHITGWSLTESGGRRENEKGEEKREWRRENEKGHVHRTYHTGYSQTLRELAYSEVLRQISHMLNPLFSALVCRCFDRSANRFSIRLWDMLGKEIGVDWVKILVRELGQSFVIYIVQKGRTYLYKVKKGEPKSKVNLEQYKATCY